jgi:hypothetical protein
VRIVSDRMRCRLHSGRSGLLSLFLTALALVARNSLAFAAALDARWDLVHVCGRYTRSFDCLMLCNSLIILSTAFMSAA